MKDPVCGMEVDPARAAGSSVYKGQTYYFCANVRLMCSFPRSLRTLSIGSLNCALRSTDR